jgi:exopolyphosphatase/guanosine-5'-triphosphate,3'-diphosphate pyrophosphatase
VKIAVIDIGTNSIHMVIAEILPNFTFEVIGREKEMTRLGDGTLSSGYLSSEVMKRGLATLKKFQYIAQTKGVQKIIAVATSAVREAHNGGDFLQKIIREISLKVRIITGEEEGRLIYLGVKHSMELPKGNTLIIDIGGGSVELMVVSPDQILFLKSLKIGAARMRDLFLIKGSRKNFEHLEKHLEVLLKEVASPILELGFSQVIGTSGTLNNLAAMTYFSNSPSTESPPRNPSLGFEDLKKLYRRLQESTPEDRSKMRGLDSLRNDLILSGAAVAYVIMKTLKIETLTSCDKAIREGMVYEYITLNRRKITREIEVPDVRRRNILKLAAKCDYDKNHAERVADLSLQIFDQAPMLHHLAASDRELLEYSALLHDIGYYIGYEKHHRHAYYLIKNVSMNGFSEEEIEMMAQVARYHRRTVPKKSHSEFRSLPKSVRYRVQWLAAILRVADALDRSHFSVVQTVRIKRQKRGILFVLGATNDLEYEIWDARRKCDLFQELSEKEVFFKIEKTKGFKTLALRAPLPVNQEVPKIVKVV